MVKDEVFGSMNWERNRWSTTVSLPYFRGAGTRVYLPDDERKRLPSFDKLPLSIETGGVRKSPSKAQQTAWQTILRSGDSIWDEAMDAAIVEYQRQRQMRARYWEVVNNPQLLSHSMPEHVDRETMKELLLPVSGMFHQEEKEKAPVACFVTFLATWWSESLNIYIRDGKISEVAPMGWFMNRKLPWIDTTAFGKLRRAKGKPLPWSGEVRLAPFSSFAAISVDRSEWDRSYSRRSDGATSDLPWNAALGLSELSVYAPTDVQPSPAQGAAFEGFANESNRYATNILEAVFELYKVESQKRRSEYSGPNPEAAFPALSDYSGMSEITELREVFVFPDTGGPIALGFKFRGPWTGDDGIGLRWRDGQVEAIGHPDLADPGLNQR